MTARRPPPSKNINDGSAPEDEKQDLLAKIGFAKDVFLELNTKGGTNCEKELREIFQLFKDAETNTLQSSDFSRVLESQRLVDAVANPLPEGFVQNLYQAWSKGLGINEARFVHGYATYLKQRQTWLQQWTAAQKMQESSTRKDTVQTVCREVRIKDVMKLQDFVVFCDKYAKAVDEVPPPPGFPKSVFEAFVAGDGTHVPDDNGDSFDAKDEENNPPSSEPEPCLPFDVWPSLMEVYASRWREWLKDWLRKREQIGFAVQEIADTSLAAQADSSMLETSENGNAQLDQHSLHIWSVSIDRSRGERLGLALRQRPKFFEVQAVDDSGLLASWNVQQPQKAVKAGDRIMDVNGETATDSINAELGRQAILVINVGRDVSKRRFAMINFTVQTDTSHNEPTGLEVQAEVEEIVEVRSVATAGLAHLWNGSQPLRAIRSGDRLMQVNDKSDAFEIADELEQPRLLDITLSRKEVNLWELRLDGSSAPLGLETHVVHSEVCYISQMPHHGLLVDWNSRADDDTVKRVKTGDQIVEVNGKSTMSDMFIELAKNKVLEIVFFRMAHPWTVTLVKPTGAAAGRAGIRKFIGINIRANHRDAVEVVSIETDGLAATWNSENPKEAIRPGDRIVRINGKTSLLEARAELLQAPMVELELLRRSLPWLVILDGSHGDPLGATVKKREDLGIEVKYIKPGGCLSIWNFCNPARAVRIGDLIKEVNGAVEVNDIQATLHQPQTFNIAFERNEVVRWSAVLDRSIGAESGIEVRVKRKPVLRVVDVFKDGTIAEWNTRHASMRVRSGQSVTQVNDEATVDAMMRELSKPCFLSISFSREEPAPASRAQYAADLADLPADLNAILEDSEATVLFDRFDRNEKGYWSDADLFHIFRLIWQRDGLPLPPRAFAKEAVRSMRDDLRSATQRIKVGEEHSTRLNSEEMVHGFSRFARRRHDLLRNWRTKRCRNVYKCPHCSGQFRVAYDSSGMELTQPAANPDELRSSAPPSSVTAKMPLASGVAVLHEGVSRAIAEGCNAFLLPPGSARPALVGRLLINAVAAGLIRGVAGLLASPNELEVTAKWLEATAPELPRRWVKDDAQTLRLSSGNPQWGRKGGTIFFSSPDVFRRKIENGKIHVEEIDLVICACGPVDLPLVSEVQADAPLTLMGGLPRVISLLDAASPVHKALMAHLEAVAGARDDLDRALGHVQVLLQENSDLAGVEVAKVSSAADNVLKIVGRYPPNVKPALVPNKEAVLSLAALQGDIDIRLQEPKKPLPEYALPGNRRTAPPLKGASYKPPAGQRATSEDSPRSQRIGISGPGVGTRAGAPQFGAGVRVGQLGAPVGTSQAPGVRVGTSPARDPARDLLVGPAGDGNRVGGVRIGGGVTVGKAAPASTGGVRVGAARQPSPRQTSPPPRNYADAF